MSGVSGNRKNATRVARNRAKRPGTRERYLKRSTGVGSGRAAPLAGGKSGALPPPAGVVKPAAWGRLVPGSELSRTSVTPSGGTEEGTNCLLIGCWAGSHPSIVVVESWAPTVTPGNTWNSFRSRQNGWIVDGWLLSGNDEDGEVGQRAREGRGQKKQREETKR